MSAQNSNSKFTPNLPIKIIGFCILGGLGYLMLLNVQPWIAVAVIAAKQVKILPFQDTLVSIPFLGGLILWVITKAATILAIFLWGIINGLESLPFFIETSFGSKVPEWIKKDLNTYRLIAYVTETVVCWVAYPTYQGGWNAIVQDFPNIDMALIDWNNMVVFLLSILGFEICLQAAKRIWALMNALKTA